MPKITFFISRGGVLIHPLFFEVRSLSAFPVKCVLSEKPRKGIARTPHGL